MNDFADWLSPIVVKELRQGMRGRAFLAIFLLVQFFMIVCALASLGDNSSREGSTALFWVMVGLATLVANPLRGLGALFGEIRANTLELLLLTQLSAWRIVAGKWLALVLQLLLMVCSVLPYVVLRFFLGGVSLTQELGVLGWMTAASVLLTAFAVGMSPFMQSPVMRVVLIFSVIPLFTFLERGGMYSPRSSVMATQVWVLAALLIGPLLVISLLEIGCGKIAPAAENHSTRKRLIAAAIVVTAAILGHWLRAQYFFLVLAAIAVTPACFGGLLEETAAIPSVYIPFVRWNFIGRLAGRLLYPGWAAGLWFFAVTAAILFGCGCRVNGKPPEWFAVWSLLEAILAPLFLARLFFRRAKSVLPFYFAIQLVLFVTAIVCSVNVARTYFYLFSWIPTLGFFWCLWSSALASHGDAVAAVSALIVSFIGLLVLSAREWRTIKAMEREAAKLL